MKPVVIHSIHSEAIEELDGAIFYYEEQKVELGFDFLAEMEQALGKIQQNPNLGSAYKITRLRRYVMQRFPFLIFYANLRSLFGLLRSHTASATLAIGDNDK